MSVEDDGIRGTDGVGGDDGVDMKTVDVTTLLRLSSSTPIPSLC